MLSAGAVRVLAVAHRAGNDLDAMRAAVENGADVVEGDVHAHRRGLELRHHKALGPLPWVWDRHGGPGRLPLVGDTWDLQPASAFPLRLAALLEAARPGATLMLDLKGAGGVGPAVLRMLHQQVPDAPLLVCARWWPSVDAFRGVRWARPVLSARGRSELVRLRRRLDRGPAPYGVSVHRSLLASPVVRALRERVQVVMTWPVNDEQSLESALSVGVTGVITDDARVLRAVVGLRTQG